MRFPLFVILSIFCTSVSYAQDQVANQTVNQTTSKTETSAQSIDQQYKKVVLTDFINVNQISLKMVKAKQRLMLPPSPIQFKAKLMQAPKPGKFSLVYDALQLWPSEQPLPEISHSAYLQADNKQVIAVYVSTAAAKQMQQLFSEQKSKTETNAPINAHIYAMHIYNYAKGPRLVVIGAQATANE
jgi:hypothetical protein